jgi:hypothetical protein
VYVTRLGFDFVQNLPPQKFSCKLFYFRQLTVKYFVYNMKTKVSQRFLCHEDQAKNGPNGVKVF